MMRRAGLPKTPPPEKGRIEVNALLSLIPSHNFPHNAAQGQKSCLLPKAHNSSCHPNQQKSLDSSQTSNSQDEKFSSYWKVETMHREKKTKWKLSGKYFCRCWTWTRVEKEKSKRCKLFWEKTNKVDSQAVNFFNIYFHQASCWSVWEKTFLQFFIS